MIYLDNAATSWPKPHPVLQAMTDFLENVGANPGRSGHRLSIAAGRIVYDSREAIAQLVNAPDPLRVVFQKIETITAEDLRDVANEILNTKEISRLVYF